MSGKEKINDFIHLGTTSIREISFPVPTYFSIQMELDRLKEENKRLREQLKEANEVIKKYMSVAFEIRSKEENPTVLQLAFYYLEKWGVK